MWNYELFSPLEFLPKDNGTCFHEGPWFMMKNIKSSGFWPLCESICAPVYHLHKRLSVPPTTHICWRVLAGLTLTGITSINLACINNPPGISSHVLLSKKKSTFLCLIFFSFKIFIAYLFAYPFVFMYSACRHIHIYLWAVHVGISICIYM